jgi:hypothetical protein
LSDAREARLMESTTTWRRADSSQRASTASSASGWKYPDQPWGSVTRKPTSLPGQPHCMLAPWATRRERWTRRKAKSNLCGAFPAEHLLCRYSGTMAKLPNPENAIVDIRKLREYCLSPDHPRGRHKARVFASALGLTADDAEELREAILSAALFAEADPAEEDEYGRRYVLDFEMKTGTGTAMVRSGWIVRRDEDVPRFTSCFVL